ncbi:hypothetical protein [uncultured Sulfitobacter sp.]|uniref:hypothetical protein n=1 Tax=uncultured Sulfitobacter sp. TaxID=191468 RepID=UPI0030F7A619
MFEGLSSFYMEYESFLNGVVTTVTLGSFIFALYRFIKSRQKKIFYQWVRSRKVKKLAFPAYSQSITFEGNVGKTLVTDIIVISNRTDVTLTDDDFAKPISIQKKPGKLIYQYTIVDTGNGASASIENTETSIELSNLHIPRLSTLTFFIAHDEAIAQVLHATTKSLPDLKQKTFKKARENTFISSSSFLIINFFNIFLLLKVRHWLIENGTDNYLILIILFLFLVGIIILYHHATQYFENQINSILRPIFGLTKDEDKLAEKYVMAYVESEIFGIDETNPK